MAATPIIGLGAGGHAKVVIEILKTREDLQIRGLLDANPILHGKELLGVPILGGDEMLEQVRKQGISDFFVGAGGIPNQTIRRILFELGCRNGFQPMAAIHPTACISPSAGFGAGPTVMAGVIVNASAKIGDNVILNTSCVVEHDCEIASHVHISPGAILAGGVKIGESAQIGAGVTIRQGIRIGRGAVVGAGSVVVKDVDPCTTVVGVPARVLRSAGQNALRS